uniref:Core Histone H2A/H2B/H3 domain-containing protein n=1 Tax=Grammatophora oceanica TaxID=210454 RepID=A0A7S1YEK6_9STRA|mmetsp:Transcript_42616/g.63220  ORF Transcript_42616/g.63220 Transcript_42616/m.63220 type:complete len:314 (+) Transcript_42616:109-1050(+)|eukprot:CAMPEP_0194066758 /NCGR_PEP_ID=MMETSP0009_2-20130614/86197_1 /TAXON_ID=210454 /ORGANISM="Grammatophora oceanica, Strain CCMP 410" /LENGTH=313 /DNA_ID=CAMNT_0038719743 /DNA_START=527 /DNA_END=1468 /DNA_ORIENTATION=-
MAANGQATNSSDVDANIERMWRSSTEDIARIDPARENWKTQTLPLARIKKIMKSEEGIYQELERERLQQEATQAGQPTPTGQQATRFMIAGEAPVLLGKACELLIKELTVRAWRHTERNRRRTLQRQDVNAAVGESEVYDFLIDIVPRIAAQPPPAPPPPPAGKPVTHYETTDVVTHAPPAETQQEAGRMPTLEHMQYMMQLQQAAAAAQQQHGQAAAAAANTVHQAPPQPQMVMQQAPQGYPGAHSQEQVQAQQVAQMTVPVPPQWVQQTANGSVVVQHAAPPGVQGVPHHHHHHQAQQQQQTHHQPPHAAQ